MLQSWTSSLWQMTPSHTSLGAAQRALQKTRTPRMWQRPRLELFLEGMETRRQGTERGSAGMPRSGAAAGLT